MSAALTGVCAIPMRAARAVLLAAVLGATACAAPTTVRPGLSSHQIGQEAERQREFVVRNGVDQAVRVARIGWPLLVANADLCGERVAGKLGIWYSNLWDYEPEYREAARRALGLGDAVSVTFLAPDGPAAAAGLLPGDRLAAINGRPLPTGEGAVAEFTRRGRQAAASGPVTFTVLRGAETRVVTVEPVRVCDYPLIVEEDSVVNAYADGEAIYVTKGMLRFVGSDEELALVLAHELAHNIMGHVEAKMQNATAAGVAGLFLDILAAANGASTGGEFAKLGVEIGAGAYSTEFEHEADYVGMYLLARAGRPLDGVEHLWRKMAADDPAAITMASSHPTTPERFLNLARTRDEIEAKRARGEPLLPNRQP